MADSPTLCNDGYEIAMKTGYSESKIRCKDVSSRILLNISALPFYLPTGSTILIVASNAPGG